MLIRHRVNGVLLMVLLVSHKCWAIGISTKPAQSGTVIEMRIPMSVTSSVGTQREPTVRAYGRGEWNHAAAKVEFVDAKQHVIRTLTHVYESTTTMSLMVDDVGHHVGEIQQLEQPTPLRTYLFKLYDVTGRVLWTTDLCCDYGTVAGAAAEMSDDGSLITVENARDRACIDLASLSARALKMPDSCVGLRIFKADGTLLRSEMYGRWARISPKGRYVVFQNADGWKIFEVGQRHISSLPKPPAKVSPKEVDDSGVVFYYDRRRPFRNGNNYRKVPGRGLEKLEGQTP